MSLGLEALCTREFAPVRQTVSARDAMIYGLSLGIGHDPLDTQALRYVTEMDFVPFPTMPVVLGHPGDWMEEPGIGITRNKVVHGWQHLRIEEPLVCGRPLEADNRVKQVIDKGLGRGAVVVMERRLIEEATGTPIATMESGVFCRADGGFGGSAGPSREFEPVPESKPDEIVVLPTRDDAALWYRLNGDYNPLHSDPAHARRAGFDRPILHGLCTFGMAAVALVMARDPSGASLCEIEARFSSPVLPGETLRFEIWGGERDIAFRARAGNRGTVVLDRGRARFG